MATRNLAAHRAHMKVYRAIRRTLQGLPVKHPMEPPFYQPCSMCGGGPSEYHHYAGYRFYWKVVAVCRPCHKSLHYGSEKRIVARGAVFTHKARVAYSRQAGVLLDTANSLSRAIQHKSQSTPLDSGREQTT